jgi:hypothetical protein
MLTTSADLLSVIQFHLYLKVAWSIPVYLGRPGLYHDSNFGLWSLDLALILALGVSFI